MPDWAQIISDALDILKFDGAVQDTLAELRGKWGAQVPALLDERFDAVGVQYMKLSHEKGAAALGQELSAFGWALYNLDDEDEYLFALIPEEERSEWERYCKKLVPAVTNIHSLLIVSNRLSVSSFTFISFIVSVFLEIGRAHV